MSENKITAEALMRRFSMQPHPENGAFVEKHYPHEGADRAASGMIYYYVAAGERTSFHRIDCDEYWCHVCGEPLEIWAVDPQGALRIHHLGTEEGCEPAVYLRKGLIFASRHAEKGADGTFLSCITVPRFHDEGFEMFSREDMLLRCPETEAFFR